MLRQLRCLAAASPRMASRGAGLAAKGKPLGRQGLVFGNGDRVLDKGVWKRFKYCQHCELILVERAKWKNTWDEVRFCSDRCRSEAKRAQRGGGAAGEPAQE